MIGDLLNNLTIQFSKTAIHRRSTNKNPHQFGALARAPALLKRARNSAHLLSSPQKPNIPVVNYKIGGAGKIIVNRVLSVDSPQTSTKKIVVLSIDLLDEELRALLGDRIHEQFACRTMFCTFFGYQKEWC